MPTPEKPAFAQTDTTTLETESPAKSSQPSPQSVSPTESSQQQSTGSEKPLATDEAGKADPPLPTEQPPPLPNEAPPGTEVDDGWAPIWDDNNQSFYFYNKFTNATQWENPRLPQISQPPPPGTTAPVEDRLKLTATTPKPLGGYDPAIHGDYDPNADYAKAYEAHKNQEYNQAGHPIDPAGQYAATGAFNRFTGKWQSADLGPERFTDENKSKRQMNAFFDVDAAANSHDGRSLKAERQSRKLTKKELKDFKEKRREKKEEKRRAWLRD